MRFYVYVRDVDSDCYPEGLARAVHLGYLENGKGRPLNKNYGILFAKGRISKENTIVPVGVCRPGIFAMESGLIGICGERVLENGEPDLTCEGKLLVWTTRDLIHFEEADLTDRKEIEKWQPSESIDVPDDVARKAIAYWSPVKATGVTVTSAKAAGAIAPGGSFEKMQTDAFSVNSPEDLDALFAVVNYCDGSVARKKILWDKDGIDFRKPGTYEVKGRIDRPCFRFPLAKGYGDPVIFPWEGKWYYISTNDNLNDVGFYAREADDVHGLFADDVTEHLILPFDPERGFEQTFWAPEFHVIGGELYILFAVSGHQWGPQCHMMKLKKGGSIICADSWEDPVRVVRKDGTPLAQGPITLDMTYVRAESGSYVIWSYRENLMSPKDTGSMLFVASVDEEKPWQLTSDPALLTRPLYGWENVSGTINNEGPYAFVKGGKVYVTYSGGAANGYTYALGLLTADGTDDLTKPEAWKKSITPVLTFYSVEGEYGPGHNSFFTLPWKASDGAQKGVAGHKSEWEEADLMIAYHGETALHDNLRCDGIRRVHFRKDGTPYFQMSAWEDLPEELASVKVTVKVN